MSPVTDITKNLVLYIAQSVKDMDGVLGITRLVKLLYLIEVEHVRRYRRPLTNLRWVFYKYGPYAFEIEDVLRSLDLDLTEENVGIGGGRSFRKLQSRAFEIGIDSIGGRHGQLVADFVLRTWALESLNRLLSFVYFETEPMADAELGKPLDFGTVAPPAIVKRLDESALHLSGAEVEALIPRLIALRNRREAEVVQSHAQLERIRSRTDPLDESVLHLLEKEEPRAQVRGLPIEIQIDEEPP